MSVHRIQRPNGSIAWRVRWREGGRKSRERTRTFDRKSDAVAFHEELRRRRRLGEVGLLIGGEQTLNAYVAGTWAPMHAATLAPKTAKHYAALYDVHIASTLGERRLADLTPEAIAGWQAERIASGAGRVATLHALALLGGILQRAVDSQRIARNPARLVRKVPRPARREVRPLAPVTVEALRLARRRAPDGESAVISLQHAGTRLRDATLISVLAYAGLRPGEALALQWGNVRERTLLIEQAASLGELQDTKTRAHRTVRLLAPLAGDLAEWKREAAPAADRALVFPGPGGRPWSKTTWDNWRRRAFDTACATIGLEGARPYDLRHSFASLLLHEGRSVMYVARQLGHDARLTLSTYGHVIDELDDDVRIGAEDAIRAARDGSCVTGASREAADA